MPIAMVGISLRKVCVHHEMKTISWAGQPQPCPYAGTQVHVSVWHAQLDCIRHPGDVA
jgi:hypothetical protein